MDFNLSNSSDHPACFDISSAKLDSMTVSELANAMEEAIDLVTEEDYDPAIIDAYLEAMDRKYPVPGDLITQTSYNDFTEKVQSLVSVRTSRPQHQFPKRFRHMLRASLAAALIAACLFGTLVAAQASGIDVLGALANWTESVFGFGSLRNDDTLNNPSNNTHAATGSVQIAPDIPEEFKELQLALAERNIPLCVPKMPEGFEAVESELYIDPTTDNVEFFVSYVQGSSCIGFDLIQTDDPTTIYEKDSTDVEEYQYAGVIHYIFSNVTNITVAWCADGTECSITTNLTPANVKDIIQTMYEE